jgi:hypothetical protein
MTYAILAWGLAALAVVVTVALSFVMFMNARMGVYMFRFLIETPPFIWLTLDDLEEKGYPPKYFKVILPELHKRKMIEVQPRDFMVEWQESTIRRMREAGLDTKMFEFSKLPPPKDPGPFVYATVCLYKFRLIVRPRRRKWNFKLFGLPDVDAAPQPAM